MTSDEGRPIACTLSSDSLQDRLAWIAALMREELLGSERDDLALKLRFRPAAIGRVREMVRKEQACCAFMTFEVAEYAGELRLTITAPEAARPAADALLSHFAARPGQ